MITTEQVGPALKALQQLIVHAKARAYDSGNTNLAELLNDLELLPEYIADEHDRTEDFVEMLQGIRRIHPECVYIVEEFERTSLPAN